MRKRIITFFITCFIVIFVGIGGYKSGYRKGYDKGSLDGYKQAGVVEDFSRNYWMLWLGVTYNSMDQ